MSTDLVTPVLDDATLRPARVLPPRPQTLETTLTHAVDLLEEFLLDIVVRGRIVPEPEVMGAHGARDMLITILACFAITE
jgi:hypothetical protein